jgi:hypothetical protein
VHEFVNFASDSISFPTVESQRDLRDSFFTQFDSMSKTFEPRYFYEEIEARFRKPLDCPKDLQRFYDEQIARTHSIRDQILQRIPDARTYSENIREIAKIMESIASHLTFCQSAKMALATSPLPLPEFNAVAHRLEIIEHRRSFVLTRFLKLFKAFPLLRRRQVLEIAAKRFADDRTVPIPFLDNSAGFVMSELERLSHLLGIVFNLDQHDGQHFTYQCENLYSQCTKISVDFPAAAMDYENFEIPTDNVNLMNLTFVAHSPRATIIVEAMENIVEGDLKYYASQLVRFQTKDLPKERFSSMIRLRFVRNRQLFDSLVNLIEELYQIRLSVERRESPQFRTSYLLYSKEQILVAVSQIVLLAGTEEVDYKRVLETCLEFQNRFLRAKLRILRVLFRVQEHANCEAISEAVHDFILLQPGLYGKSFYQPFLVQIDTMETIGTILEVLFELQQIVDRQMSSILFGNYPVFEFGMMGESFSILSVLGLLGDFISAGKVITEEFCDSMEIRRIYFKSYLQFGIWSQLRKELLNPPDRLLFVVGFESIDFKFPVDSSVNWLLFCPALDDVEFAGPAISRQDDSAKAKFAANLRTFAELGWKLRRMVWERNLLLPVYLEQRAEVGDLGDFDAELRLGLDFSEPDRIIELCASGDLDELKKTVRSQKLFNQVLKVAVRYNSFRSDSTFIRDLCDLKEEDAKLFITRSNQVAVSLSDEKASILRHSMDKIFSHFDYLSIVAFCSISSSLNLSDVDKIVKVMIPFMVQYELATIVRYERDLVSRYSSCLVFRLQNRLLTQDREIDLFAIPSINECLSLTADPKLLQLTATRLRLIYLAALRMTLNLPRNRYFEAFAKRDLPWDSVLFSMLADPPPPQTVDEALILETREEIFGLTQFKLCVLGVIDKVFNSKSPELVPYLGMARKVWLLMHQLQSGSRGVSRYVSPFFTEYPYYASDAFRSQVRNQYERLEARMEGALLIRSVDCFGRAALKFCLEAMSHSVMKYAYFMLVEKVDYHLVNPVTAVTMMTRDILEGATPEYSNKVVMIAFRQRPTGDKKLVSETVIIRSEFRQMQVVIQTLLLTAQLSEMQKLSASINASLTGAFSVLTSSLKPNCYKAKKLTNPVFQRVVYLPSAANANRHFQQEVRYAHLKLVSLLCEQLHTISREDSPHQAVIDLAKFRERLLVLSNIFSQFFSSSTSSVLETWVGIADNLRKSFREDAECNANLNQIVKNMIHQYERHIESADSFAMSTQYLQLSSLRKSERDNIHEQSIFEKAAAVRIRQKYEDRIKVIKIEAARLRREFPRVWSSLFNFGRSAIDRQMSQLKVLMDSIQDQMDFARRSLEESQRWYDMLQKRSDSEIADSEEEEDVHEPHEFGSTNPRFKPKQDEKPARSPSPVKPYNNELILAKIEAVKCDIQKLHKRILHERLTRCVMRIGTISYHTRMIAKVAEEKRLAARQLWHGQRVFTQEVQDLENCLREGYQRLTVAECESERLRTEIEQGKTATAKLTHWQDIHLHAADRIVKDIEALSVSRDVNVDKLLATLAQKHEELDALNAEQEEFDREYEFSVREPAVECERVQRTIYRTVEEKINLRKQIGAEETEDHEEVNFAEICEMNRQLRLENDEMRREVSELEKNVTNRGVDQARYMTALFAPPKTSRVSGVYRLPAKVKRPEMTPRGHGKSKFSRVQFD